LESGRDGWALALASLPGLARRFSFSVFACFHLTVLAMSVLHLMAVAPRRSLDARLRRSAGSYAQLSTNRLRPTLGRHPRRLGLLDVGRCRAPPDAVLRPAWFCGCIMPASRFTVAALVLHHDVEHAAVASTVAATASPSIARGRSDGVAPRPGPRRPGRRSPRTRACTRSPCQSPPRPRRSWFLRPPGPIGARPSACCRRGSRLAVTLKSVPRTIQGYLD